MRGFQIATLSLAVLGLAVLLVASPANAQSNPQAAPSPLPGVSSAASELSDQKLDAVASALEEVAKLERDYRQQIDEAPQTDRQRILDEAQTVITRAVTDRGLSVEEYGTIIRVAANDADLRQKILQRLPSAK